MKNAVWILLGCFFQKYTTKDIDLSNCHISVPLRQALQLNFFYVELERCHCRNLHDLDFSLSLNLHVSNIGKIFLQLNISCVAKIVDLKRSFIRGNMSRKSSLEVKQLDILSSSWNISVKKNEIFLPCCPSYNIYTPFRARNLTVLEVLISSKFEFRKNWTVFFICDGRLFARGSVCIFLAENFKGSHF